MSLTAAQKKARDARGNVLVMAGAGTGKTSTLVERCIACLEGDPPAALDELLIVTFTEAAAAEARERIRAALEKKFAETAEVRWAQQLALFDTAHIGTLHGFCFRLVRQHFYQLGLDPQMTVLDAGQARLLADETLTELLDDHYAGKLPDSPAVQELIETYAGGRDEPIRSLVQRLHAYGQTRADSADWLAGQIAMFAAEEPEQWREWLLAGIAEWRDTWQPDLQRLAPDNPKAQECAEIFESLPRSFSSEAAAVVVARIAAAKDGPWPPRRKVELRKPLEALFEEADFLKTLVPPPTTERRSPNRREPEPPESKRAESERSAPMAAADPLAQDWSWSRKPMLALLQLAKDFAARFRDRKRDDGVVDFHDLEQLALELLWQNSPTIEVVAKPYAADESKRSDSLAPAPSGGEGRGEGAIRSKPRAETKAQETKRNSSPLSSPPLCGGEGEALPAHARQPSPIALHWRAKIRFVFVDEYQDINAAQDQIIAALSRDGAEANRFLVGDVKQSIYRFRLADPGIFRRYARDWRGPAGQTIPLAENFRSRPAILDFVNAVFTPLLREEVGGVAYDNEARLIPGIARSTDAPREPEVEIRFRLTEQPAARETSEDALDDLQAAEKEARHIALRLRQLKTDGFQVLDRETKQPRPVEWRDMAVLLRSPSTKAEGYAKQFERVGVPLDVVRGGFYESLEVADLLNLLRLLDNPLQDVPLLAVLRSPLVGLSLDELATIRLAARGHFWTALVCWAEAQSLESEVWSPESAPTENHASRLTHHVAQFLTHFTRWRKLARQASLSACLDTILTETHYAEWLRAQERGAQRFANAQRLLGLAEQFDLFQRQGLFRFLRFIEAQQAAEVEPEVAASGTADAVRLISIHQSKGCEFPVVVVADLGKPFNYQDLRAEIILDERFGLCPQVKPPDTGARYPSLAHWLVRQRQKRELLGEELRLLYVAMTRARDKLILTGSMPQTRWDALPALWPQITPRALLDARSCADWLRLWLAQDQNETEKLCACHELEDENLREDPGETTSAPDALQLAPGLDAATLDELRTKLAWNYPFEPATLRAAKTSVTGLRRQVEEEVAEEADSLFVPPQPRTLRTKPVGKLSAAEIGTAHHKFLEHVVLAHAASRAGLQAEAQRLTGAQRLTIEEAGALDLVALERFWQSEVGQKIRAHADDVRRELPFTARFAPAELDEIVGGVRAADGESAPRELSEPRKGEFVVVQGVADLVVLHPAEIWLMDFKTDELAVSDVAGKARFYAPQVQLYGRALSRIYARPVTQAWLHFLACGETAAVSISRHH